MRRLYAQVMRFVFLPRFMVILLAFFGAKLSLFIESFEISEYDIAMKVQAEDRVRERLLETWAALAPNWGINKTMAQIHALLLLEKDPMSTEEIMQGLEISRGNANMNLRSLLDWSLAYKVHIKGDRKDYFIAEKDMWQITKNIMVMRKKKELEPLQKLITDLEQEDLEKQPEHVALLVTDLEKMINKSDSLLHKAINADKNWFMRAFAKLI